MRQVLHGINQQHVILLDLNNRPFQPVVPMERKCNAVFDFFYQPIVPTERKSS
jgi:hypothetical protein